MRKSFPRVLWTALVLAGTALGAWQPAVAGKVTVELTNGDNVTAVGAVCRFDDEGNALYKFSKIAYDANAKLKGDDPGTPHFMNASAVKEGSSRWVFKSLPKGKHDLIIVGKPSRLRIEGWYYAAVLEFDPAFPPTATAEDEVREDILGQISRQQHYENIVKPLYLGGDKEAVRVLVMLIRDKATTLTDFAGAATMRHEIWQFSFQHGGWTKEKRTRVLDRSLMNVDELRKWTWVWDPKLGGIEVKNSPITIKYDVTAGIADKKLQGLYPY